MKRAHQSHSCMRREYTIRDAARQPTPDLSTWTRDDGPKGGLAYPSDALHRSVSDDLHRSGHSAGEAGPRGGIRVMARSASAVMVSDGFTPGLALTADPSMTYSPS